MGRIRTGVSGGVYDVENRLLEASKNAAVKYGYGADNRRIFEAKRATVHSGGDGIEEVVTWWSGQRVGRYKVRWNSEYPNNGAPNSFVLARLEAENVWFGGKPLRLGAETNITVDRLGSVRRGSGRDYFPYGQEAPGTTAGDKEKYGTYRHDGATDLSYADQRYYATGAGRFMTADPYKASAGAEDPGSWNRYAYVGGDPVNFGDPEGLARCSLVHVVRSGAGYRAMFDCFSEGSTLSERFETDYYYDPNSRADYRRAESDLASGIYGQDLDEAEAFWMLADAYAMAQEMLQKNRECFEMFGTAQSRANGWRPDTVLGKLYSGQGGLGSLGYGPTLGATGLTSPTLTSAGLGARINVNRADWVSSASNTRDHAFTLLHELGHAYNLLSLRGSGGSTIRQFDVLPGRQLDNELEILYNCGGMIRP